MKTEEAVCSTLEKPRRWYNSYTFPLIPQFKIRPANEYNTKAISFHWLFIHLWTLDSFEFEVSIILFSSHWGVGFNGQLPYLRWVIAIPMPPRFQNWIQRNLWRQVITKTNHP